MSDNLISFTVSNTNSNKPLTFQLWVNDQLLYNQSITDSREILCTFADSAGKKILKFVQADKTHQHTVVDNQGNIVEDGSIVIEQAKINGVTIQDLLTKNGRYYHDFNGSGQPVVDNFFGLMSFNGHLIMEFTCPVYLWLLEN